MICIPTSHSSYLIETINIYKINSADSAQEKCIILCEISKNEPISLETLKEQMDFSSDEFVNSGQEILDVIKERHQQIDIALLQRQEKDIQLQIDHTIFGKLQRYEFSPVRMKLCESEMTGYYISVQHCSPVITLRMYYSVPSTRGRLIILVVFVLFSLNNLYGKRIPTSLLLRC